MTEVVAAVSTVVGIALQLKDSIERVKYNRETHRAIIDRISDSLRRLKTEARAVSTKSSPGLLKAIGKLKTELEHALEKCQRAPISKNTSGIRQWFHRDTIEAALRDAEKQISSCFHEFTALTAVRIERKLGDHHTQVNRKLDELLQRSNPSHAQLPARPRPSTPRGRSAVQGRAGTPTLKTRFADRADTSADGARGGSLDLPRPRTTNKHHLSVSTSTQSSSMEDLTFKVQLPSSDGHKKVLRRKPPPVVRSDTSVTTASSATSASSVSLSSMGPSSPPSVGSTPTVARGMTTVGARAHVRARSHPVLLTKVGQSETPRTAAIPIPPSPTSPIFSSYTTFPEIPFSPDTDHFSEANDLDNECRHLRSLKHPNEALSAARKAVTLRRSILASNPKTRNITALARSLTYAGRCLRDLYIDEESPTSKRKGSSRGMEALAGQELMKILSECAELYREAFREDKSLRVELATTLYNLSTILSDPSSKQSPGIGTTTPMTSLSSLHTRDAAIARSQAHNVDLESALDAAEESVHHFTVLEREEPETYSMDLANTQLNLSFILSDLGRTDKALAIARKAVILAYRLTSADPRTQERVRIMRTLHKSLMRVSYCLRELGRNAEADEAEMEAKDTLKKQFLVLGS